VILWGGVLLALYALVGQALFDLPHFGLTIHGNVVVRTLPDGPAERAGVTAGDELLLVNGKRIDRIPFLTEMIYSGVLGRTIQLELISPYGQKSVVIEGVPGPPRWRWRAAASFVAGIGFLLIGLYTAWQPARRLTFLFFLLCSGFSVILLPIAPPSPPGAPILIGSVRSLAALMLPPLIMHFFLVFPTRRHVVEQAPSVLKWIYVPAIIGLVALLYVCTATLWNAPGAGTLTLALELLSAVTFILFSVLALVSFIAGYVRVRSRSERRRYSVIFWGTIIGIAPLLIVTVVRTLSPETDLSWTAFVLLGLLLIPGSFAYAVARHQIFDIEVFVKRSAVFSILTACLVVIAIAIHLLFGVVLERLTGQRSTWVMVLSLIIIAGVFSPLRKRIERFVDRSFFRERYDDRRVLRELSQALPGILDLGALVREVVEKLARTLRVREAALFFEFPEEEDTYTLAYASGMPADDLDLPPLPSRLIRIIKRSGGPMRSLELEERLPFGALQDDEERLLTTFHSGVLVPFVAGDRLLGVLALGRRMGGESYGAEDLELLRAIAGQATVAMQNALLHMKEVERQRIERELSLARHLQQQLLPLKDPIFTRMEIAGGTVSCYEVGGDFYDYVHLPDGRLGIVVGDAYGKGIPAAMIMASLSATLRAEAVHHEEPGSLMARLNDRACKTLEPGQFLSLFYGIISPEEMTIHYANAGHPPPLVIEPNGRLLHLTTGGMLLGVDAGAVHGMDSLQCVRGAAILFPTDGLIEASRGDVEFGEERLVDLARGMLDASASAIRERIMEEVEKFLDGKIDDDITLIVLKVL